MQWRRVYPLLFLLLVLLPLVSVSTGEKGYEWIRTVTMLVPAVAETPEGYVGVSSKLVVSVAYPGHGIVYFAAEPLTQLDTQAAARIAAIVASILAGVDFYSYDYFIHLKANSTIVGGPSASGAMAVAILAALRNRSIPSSFSMTGMVDPDATLGPVGGIPEKLEAMARNGIKVFVIPAGQSIALDLNTGRYVNVTSLGKTLGVRVVEADTILDAYVAATGDKELLSRIEALSAKNINIYNVFPALGKNLRGVTSLFKSVAETNLSCTQKFLNNLDPAVKGFVQRLVNEANQYLVEEKSLEKQGLLYSAASRAFGAAIDATLACSIASAFSSNNTIDALVKQVKHYTNVANKVAANAAKALNEMLKRGELNTVELQVAIAVENRLDSTKAAINEASYYLKAAEQSTGFGKIEALLNALQDAVYSYYRSLTIDQWLGLLKTSKTLSSATIGRERIISLAENYYYIASSAATYLEALATSAGIPASPPRQLAEAQKLLSRGISGQNVSEALKVLAISISSLADTATTIHKIFNTNTEKTLKASHKALKILIGLDIAKNATPILPALYSEYASIQQDIGAQLSLYMQAASYAILLNVLTQHQAQQTTPISTATTSAPRPEKTKTVTKTVTKTSATIVVKTVKQTITKKEVTTSTETKVSTITETITKTLPLTSYAPLIAIALIVGVAIGYLLGRSKPSL